MTIELVKEVKLGNTRYWVKINESSAFIYPTLEEAEEKYQALLTNLSQSSYKWVDTVEVLKSANLTTTHPLDEVKTYTEADMLKCWNTVMVAMTCKNPIFFSDYIKSLNKQD